MINKNANLALFLFKKKGLHLSKYQNNKITSKYKYVLKYFLNYLYPLLLAPVTNLLLSFFAYE